MMILEWLKAVLYGIVEGITEWLPVSSTGHLILLQDWLPFRFTSDPVLLAEFGEMFEVVIQLGAILAVVILFWGKLWPFSKKKTVQEKRNTWSIWLKVVIASIPAAFVGIVLDKVLEALTSRDINDWLYNSIVVATMLIVYGVAFILIEHFHKGKEPRISSLEEIDCKTALYVGLFQALSIVPGTSRSGSTILGSMLLGLSRTAGAEFSFFMAIPAMVGASGIKILGFLGYVLDSNAMIPLDAWIVLAVGCLVSFVVSLVAIRFLMDFLKKHSFASFGVYRILLGALVLLFWALR
ncbi:MAG: undecaprenyl-diphosphate phosphatase [Clostridia bacterium]|nr:undecaprenyl-diphosphate phosphatase [Clostridia bacterium]MBQ5833452.1 undecaprenyl-diphosphate phosphatase [Clostridia bacterium]